MYVGAMRIVFFKQKTAYEWRISDGSSDVSSADLDLFGIGYSWGGFESLATPADLHRTLGTPDHDGALVRLQIRSEERRGGKECVRRVDLGGGRIIKTKTHALAYTHHSTGTQHVFT